MTIEDKNFLWQEMENFCDMVKASSMASITGERLVTITDVKNAAMEIWTDISNYYFDQISKG